MPITLNDDEAYAAFLFFDSEARRPKGRNDTVFYFRDLLMPIYSEWHKANPGKVHPPLDLTRK